MCKHKICCWLVNISNCRIFFSIYDNVSGIPAAEDGGLSRVYISRHDNNLYKYRVTKWISFWVVGLPGAFGGAFGCGGGEEDAQSGLSPCAGGVEGLFLGCAHGVAADPFQAVGRVPVTGAVVSHQPLLVDLRTGGDRCPIGNGHILQIFKAVRAWTFCGGGSDGWGGEGCEDGRDGCGGRQRLRGRNPRWRAEGCRCGLGGACRGKHKACEQQQF